MYVFRECRKILRIYRISGSSYQLQKINLKIYLPPNICKLQIKVTNCNVCYKPFTENNYKVPDTIT